MYAIQAVRSKPLEGAAKMRLREGGVSHAKFSLGGGGGVAIPKLISSYGVGAGRGAS